MSSPYLARESAKIDAPIPPGCDEILAPAAPAFVKDFLTLEAYRYL